MATLYATSRRRLTRLTRRRQALTRPGHTAGPPAATRSRCSGSLRARYSVSPRSRTTRPLPTSVHSRRRIRARSQSRRHTFVARQAGGGQFRANRPDAHRFHFDEVFRRQGRALETLPHRGLGGRHDGKAVRPAAVVEEFLGGEDAVRFVNCGSEVHGLGRCARRLPGLHSPGACRRGDRAPVRRDTCSGRR